MGRTQPRKVGCLQAADVDNDDIDLFIGNNCGFELPEVAESTTAEHANQPPPDDGQHCVILLNDGSGVCSASKDALTPNDPTTTTTALFFDADRDGCVDLLVGNRYRQYGDSHNC